LSGGFSHGEFLTALGAMGVLGLLQRSRAQGPHLLRLSNTFTTFVVFGVRDHNCPFSATAVHDFDVEFSMARLVVMNVRASVGRRARGS
jgi:hypothetical protein